MPPGRKPIEELWPDIGRHVLLLVEYGHSTREIADMVSKFNGIRISRGFVRRFLKRHEVKQNVPVPTESKRATPLGRFGWKCSECQSSRLLVDREKHEVVCTSCGEVLQTLRSRHIDKGVQVGSYTPEASLSEGHGLGSWINVRDFYRLGLTHVSWQLKNLDNAPTRLRAMRLFASKLIKNLDGLQSRTNDIRKARYAQVRKATDEILTLVYERMLDEIENSATLTEDILTIRGKEIVLAIVDSVLEDFLGENHRVLLELRRKNPVNQALRQKIEALIESRIPIPASAN